MVLKKKILWAIGSIIALTGIYHIILWYLSSSHAINAGVHWLLYSNSPLVYLVFGIIVISIAAFRFSRKVMIGTIIGYIVGLVSAVLLNRDSQTRLVQWYIIMLGLFGQLHILVLLLRVLYGQIIDKYIIRCAQNKQYIQVQSK